VTIRPAACQVVPEVSRSRFQQYDVLPAHQSKVVCHRGADDTASDDDNAGVAREWLAGVELAAVTARRPGQNAILASSGGWRLWF